MTDELVLGTQPDEDFHSDVSGGPSTGHTIMARDSQGPGHGGALRLDSQGSQPRHETRDRGGPRGYDSSCDRSIERSDHFWCGRGTRLTQSVAREDLDPHVSCDD